MSVQSHTNVTRKLIRWAPMGAQIIGSNDLTSCVLHIFHQNFIFLVPMIFIWSAEFVGFRNVVCISCTSSVYNFDGYDAYHIFEGTILNYARLVAHNPWYDTMSKFWKMYQKGIDLVYLLLKHTETCSNDGVMAKQLEPSLETNWVLHCRTAYYYRNIVQVYNWSSEMGCKRHMNTVNRGIHESCSLGFVHTDISARFHAGMRRTGR